MGVFYYDYCKSKTININWYDNYDCTYYLFIIKKKKKNGRIRSSRNSGTSSKQ